VGVKELSLTWQDYANLSKDGTPLFRGEELANTINSVSDLDAALAEGVITSEDYGNRFNALFENAVNNTKSLNDLNNLIKEFNLNEEEVSYALLQVASNYESCAQEAKEYEMSLARLSKDPSDEELKK
jgi:hypothetical protein